MGGEVDSWMRQRDRDRDQQMRDCLAIFRAKQMIKITETLMTKPAPQGKMVSESVPGGGKAVEGSKSIGGHLLGPDGRRWGSGRRRERPGGNDPEDGDGSRVTWGL